MNIPIDIWIVICPYLCHIRYYMLRQVNRILYKTLEKNSIREWCACCPYNDNIDMIYWLFNTNLYIINAIIKNDLMLKHLVRFNDIKLLELCMDRHDNHWTSKVSAIAAQYGYLDILKYAHNNNYIISYTAASYAAATGHLDCLIYLHENKYEWNKLTVIFSIIQDQYECFRYAWDNECPRPRDYKRLAMQNGSKKILQFFYEIEPINKYNIHISLKYLRSVELDYIKLLIQKYKYIYDETTIAAVIKRKSFECLVYLRRHNCPWDEGAYYAAAVTDQIDVLKYLYENNCRMIFYQTYLTILNDCMDDRCLIFIRNKFGPKASNLVTTDIYPIRSITHYKDI